MSSGSIGVDRTVEPRDGGLQVRLGLTTETPRPISIRLVDPFPHPFPTEAVNLTNPSQVQVGQTSQAQVAIEARVTPPSASVIKYRINLSRAVSHNDYATWATTILPRIEGGTPGYSATRPRQTTPASPANTF